MSPDTIFALASGRPPAAIAVIRVSGPNAHAAGTALAGDLPAARSVELRTLRDPATGDLLDQAIVLRFDGPASATGEDVVELQCHGGRAVIDGLIAVLGTIQGLRPARPGEFTRRAFENGRIDLTEAEGLADLLEAETESQRKAALAIAEGGLRRQIGAWRARVLMLSAAAERAIDYDDDDEAMDPRLQQDCAALESDLRQILDRPRVERLKDGLLVVIAGPPNVGKSSLINVIAGEDRAIVTEIPGTTRDHLEVPLALGGIPVRLTDTAGLRETDDRVEAIGVERARMLVDAADILVWLGPGSGPSHPRMVPVHSKCDVLKQERGRAIPVSAVTGEGIGELLERVRTLALTLMPDEGAISLNRRQADLIGVAAGALREAAGAPDIPILAECLRRTRTAFDRLTGRAGINDVLDALFSRFCLGK